MTFSGTWVFHTGTAITFPSGRYEIDGMTVNYFTERNGYRMPPIIVSISRNMDAQKDRTIRIEREFFPVQRLWPQERLCHIFSGKTRKSGKMEAYASASSRFSRR
jgi:hypothetical protein